MSAQLTLDVEAVQLIWQAPDTRMGCGRDPAMGPGSCTYWWELCPKAEKRGCYRLWASGAALLDHWSKLAPADWEAAPDLLQPLTARCLKDRGDIEIRQPEDVRWQWRRTPPAEVTA